MAKKTKEKVYSCHLCGNEYKTKNGLNKHIQSKHSKLGKEKGDRELGGKQVIMFFVSLVFLSLIFGEFGISPFFAFLILIIYFSMWYAGIVS